jgi:hypothetical protein
MNQRRITELVGQMELLGDEHHFRKRQRVEQGESMRREVNVMFGQNHGLIDDQPPVHGCSCRCRN